MDHLIHMDEQN